MRRERRAATRAGSSSGTGNTSRSSAAPARAPPSRVDGEHLDLDPVGIAEEDGVALRLVVVLGRRVDHLGRRGDEDLVHAVDVVAVAGVERQMVQPGCERLVRDVAQLRRRGREDQPLHPARGVGEAPSEAAVVAPLPLEPEAAHQRVVEPTGRLNVGHAEPDVVDEGHGPSSSVQWRMATIWTIGYEKLLPPALVAELEEAGVERLLDVRYRPQSRRPGMSKTRLGELLGSRGIAYEHRRELGTPPDIRWFFKHNRVAEGAPAFRTYVEEHAGDVLDELAAELDRAPRTALMCLEADPATCHRRQLADALRERRPDLEVVDL